MPSLHPLLAQSLAKLEELRSWIGAAPPAVPRVTAYQVVVGPSFAQRPLLIAWRSRGGAPLKWS